MFDHTVAKAIVEGHAHSIGDAHRYGPAADAILRARRRPIRGFARRLAARLAHRRPMPAYRPQVDTTRVAG